jgi:AraC family transcriptional regulator
LYSLQVYDDRYFHPFNPENKFEKWAALEVADFSVIPEGMKLFELPAGLYAVFLHVGPASAGPTTFRSIYGTWLPNSNYELDARPHFEVLGEKYKNEDPASEEEIWIPIRNKK